MTTLDICLTYFGAVVLVLLYLYGTKNYLITLIAGFISFCVFYYAFGYPDFKWTLDSMLPPLKEAGIIYIISFAIGIIIYKLIPLKQNAGIA